jgi:hypothetical protein
MVVALGRCAFSASCQPADGPTPQLWIVLREALRTITPTPDARRPTPDDGSSGRASKAPNVTRR